MLRVLGHEVIGFTDPDQALWGQVVDGIPVIGGDHEILKKDCSEIFLAIGLGGTGDNKPRKRLFEEFFFKGYSFPVLIHPSSFVSGNVVLGSGSLVMAGALLQTGCRVGKNVIINTGALADHDCVIGDHAHLAPGTVLSGNVFVACMAHIGTGAVIIQNIRVGEGALVAAGSVAIRDVKEGSRVSGVPAKEMKTQKGEIYNGEN